MGTTLADTQTAAPTTYEDVLTSSRWRTIGQLLRSHHDHGCQACGSDVPLQVHHAHYDIVAKATGGQWTDANMATLCHPCNMHDGVNRVTIQTHLETSLFGSAK